jgi:putative transposase
MILMPRTARIKSPVGIYHVMIRSISEIDLFKNDEDKNRYLETLKKYQSIFLFKVYSYCLMTNHGHFVIDTCGSDISKVMKCVNQSYVAYYNRKYERHGHVFQDRFKSKPVDKDEYLIMLTAYIHQNPSSIPQYKNNTDKYKYSSLGIYLGIRSDNYGILDYKYILEYFNKNIRKARTSYLNFLDRAYKDSLQPDTMKDLNYKFENEKSLYESGHSIIIRNMSTEEVISFLNSYTGTNFNINIKYSRKNYEFKCIYVLIARSLCGLSLKQICGEMGNMTFSNVGRMCNKGYEFLSNNDNYKNLIPDLIKHNSCISA